MPVLPAIVRVIRSLAPSWNWDMSSTLVRSSNQPASTKAFSGPYMMSGKSLPAMKAFFATGYI
jgi:hypothetical protein